MVAHCTTEVCLFAFARLDAQSTLLGVAFAFIRRIQRDNSSTVCDDTNARGAVVLMHGGCRRRQRFGIVHCHYERSGSGGHVIGARANAI
jgi:hypothetical protein